MEARAHSRKSFPENKCADDVTTTTTRSSFQGRALFFSCEIESSKQMFDKLCSAINNFEIFSLSHSCAGYYSSILHYKIPSTDVEFKNLQKRKNLIFIHRSRYILRAKSREGRDDVVVSSSSTARESAKRR